MTIDSFNPASALISPLRQVQISDTPEGLKKTPSPLVVAIGKEKLKRGNSQTQSESSSIGAARTITQLRQMDLSAQPMSLDLASAPAPNLALVSASAVQAVVRSIPQIFFSPIAPAPRTLRHEELPFLLASGNLEGIKALYEQHPRSFLSFIKAGNLYQASNLSKLAPRVSPFNVDQCCLFLIKNGAVKADFYPLANDGLLFETTKYLISNLMANWKLLQKQHEPFRTRAQEDFIRILIREGNIGILKALNPDFIRIQLREGNIEILRELHQSCPNFIDYFNYSDDLFDQIANTPETEALIDHVDDCCCFLFSIGARCSPYSLNYFAVAPGFDQTRSYLTTSKKILTQLIQEGNLSFIRELHLRNTLQFEAFVKGEDCIFELMDFETLHPEVDLKQVDECLVYLLSISGGCETFQATTFLDYECYGAAKFMIDRHMLTYKEFGSDPITVYDVLRAFALADAQINPEKFLEAISKNFAIDTNKKYGQIVEGFFFAARYVNSRDLVRFLNRQDALFLHLFHMAKDIPILDELFVGIVNFKCAKYNDSEIACKNLMIDLFLPTFAPLPGTGHLLLNNPDFEGLIGDGLIREFNPNDLEDYFGETRLDILQQQLIEWIDLGGQVKSLNAYGHSILFEVVKRNLLVVARKLIHHKDFFPNLPNRIYCAFYASENPNKELEDLYTCLSNKRWLTQAKPTMHQALEAIMNIPFQNLAHGIEILQLVKKLKSNPAIGSIKAKRAKNKMNGTWRPSKAGVPFVWILFNRQLWTPAQKSLRKLLGIYLLPFFNDDKVMIETGREYVPGLKDFAKFLFEIDDETEVVSKLGAFLSIDISGNTIIERIRSLQNSIAQSKKKRSG